ncbi:MAG: hypothetical protein DSY80_05410 [Desulfocapsa sp.]|nr:MAG: hypothetical protein DSY80_05410 [Desulfocapsa sp.]
MSGNLIAIDPGITGAYAIFEKGNLTCLGDMPIDNIGGNREVSAFKLAEIFHDYEITDCVIERVHSSPRQGVTSAFNFGMSFKAPIAVANALGIEEIRITPQLWKAYHGLLKKPKDAARILALELHPEFANDLKRKKDCDRADALLLGEFYLRNWSD